MSRVDRAVSVRLFGDAAVLVDLGDLHGAHALARLLRAEFAGDRSVDDVVVGFGTVTVLVDRSRGHPGALLELVQAHAERATGSGAAPSPGHGEAAGAFVVPVCFDGPDLPELADQLHMDPAGVADLLTGADLQVAFVGFSPGFSYLVGLPSMLAEVGRRARPRPAVPAGSVAVGGGFAGIYPGASPGGWYLVGRTDAVVFDPLRPPHALLGPGRAVRFVRAEEVAVRTPAVRRPLRAGARPSLVVEQPGSCTLVEDGGRRGVAGVGVPGAGAADAVDLCVANRLVGNEDLDAALEITLRGPRLRAGADVHVALVAAAGIGSMLSMTVDGRAAPVGQPVPLSAGQLVEVGSVAGPVRAVLAVSGGLRVESLFGSRSSDLLSGLGPGALEAGDELALGPCGRPRGRLAVPPAGRHPAVLRVLAGPDEARSEHGDNLEWLTAGRWRTAPDSNRIGTRLLPEEGAARAEGAAENRDPGPGTTSRRVRVTATEVASRGMVRGAIQLPPGGELVVLGPDHPTVGGYCVPAVVVSADLRLLAHLAPATPVRFEVVDQAEAQRAFHHLEVDLAGAVTGWFPTRAG
ncbi:MAG TPA: carboxyltransferase domain-containing protein [Acidimicrobiales bacterium]|nr:carboxyltransferase domain-containing protein [Acidimicrobiales bacterium]